MKNGRYLVLFLFVSITSFGCSHDKKKPAAGPVIYRGLYSFGPEVKSFKNCDTGQEFWAVDSSAKLELGYSQLNFEKPYEPVYVEIEGQKIKSGPDGVSSEFDSTIVVKKLIKLSKEIPAGMCE